MVYITLIACRRKLIDINLKNAPKHRSYKLLFIIIALAAATLFVAYRLPVSRTASVFCGVTCHSMNPAYQTWRRSGHAQTACLACHSDGSATGRLRRFVELSAKHILKESAGPKKAVHNRRVPDDACVGCHEPKRRSRPNGRIIDHQAHLKIGLNCKNCHNRTPHEDAPEYSPLSPGPPLSAYRNYLTMRQGCWRCHQKGGKFVRRDGKTVTGPYRQGRAVAPTACKTCHADFAMNRLRSGAQNVWLRHVEQPGWRRGTVHGPVARNLDFKPCWICHNPTRRCTACHKGVSMPHADDWIQPDRHGAAAKAMRTEPCRLCHRLKDVPNCSANGHHHVELAAAYRLDLSEVRWKSGKDTHGVVARGTGGRPCLRCHEQTTWCATQCHQGVVMPHGPGWRQTHFQTVGYARRSPGGTLNWQPERASACRMCHNPDGKDQDWCQSCHHRQFYQANPALKQKGAWYISGMAHAGKAAGISRDLQSGNVGVCVAACHPGRIAFCAACHQRFMDD